MKRILVGAAIVSIVGQADAARLETGELERLNKALYDKTFVVRDNFNRFPLSSRESNFYNNEILDAVNTIHYAAEEVVSMQMTLTAYHVPEDDGLLRYNMVYRMMQVCTIARGNMADMAENNRVSGTKVDVAQLAGAGDAVCGELTRLWNILGKQKP
jgi:hypothetical protein